MQRDGTYRWNATTPRGIGGDWRPCRRRLAHRSDPPVEFLQHVRKREQDTIRARRSPFLLPDAPSQPRAARHRPGQPAHALAPTLPRRQVGNKFLLPHIVSLRECWPCPPPSALLHRSDPSRSTSVVVPQCAAYLRRSSAVVVLGVRLNAAHCPGAGGASSSSHLRARREIVSCRSPSQAADPKRTTSTRPSAPRAGARPSRCR